MAKERLRGASKAGKIAITRWVTKDTVAALGRLRGQTTHPHPTEGEVIDAAIALYEATCRLCREAGQKLPGKCPYHIAAESLEVFVGENVGDGQFRGAKLSADEQRRAASQGLVVDDIDQFTKSPIEEFASMQHAVNPAPDSPLEQRLHETSRQVREWAQGPDYTVPPPGWDKVVGHDAGDGRDAGSVVIIDGLTLEQVEIPDGACLHCGGEALAICAQCFLAGHRGNRLNCFVCMPKDEPAQ